MRPRCSLLTTGFVLLMLAVALLSTAPAARAQELRRLTLEQLRNGQYHLPLRGDEETPIRFDGGRGSIKHVEGTTEQVHAGLVGDLVTFGDLDGDQIADAAVVVFIDTGGSGTFIHVVAMHDREGTPVQAAGEFLGDRVRVESLTIWGGHIFVTMLAHGPGDGLCCPSIEISRAFALHGRRLVPTQVLW